ncbi:hypothetical protein [Nocardia vaccinii]|uniref:hypothetical protein n=1 Tax=Nocardia vaccinii TaxID=1822 RepID=UPI000A9AD0B7|nr:hypothetical protein [Nocardia vaccinii]
MSARPGNPSTPIPRRVSKAARASRQRRSRAGWTAVVCALLQLQGLTACGDPEVREVVRARMARMWDTISETTGLDPVTVKSFLAFGMLLNNAAALDIGEVDEPWAAGVRTRILPGLFEHITAETNR